MSQQNLKIWTFARETMAGVLSRFPFATAAEKQLKQRKHCKKHCFLQCFHCLSCFSAAVAKENLLQTPAIVSLTNFQIFKFCCDIQGSHLIGYLWVSLIIDQSECLICFFLCTELTPFFELPENCIYLNQSELSNFFMYIINPVKEYWITFSDLRFEMEQKHAVLLKKQGFCCKKKQ